jgi:hypothetical protein
MRNCRKNILVLVHVLKKMYAKNVNQCNLSFLDPLTCHLLLVVNEENTHSDRRDIVSYQKVRKSTISSTSH